MANKQHFLSIGDLELHSTADDYKYYVSLLSRKRNSFRLLLLFAVTIWPAAGQIASPNRKRYLTGRRSNSLKYYQMLFGRLHNIDIVITYTDIHDQVSIAFND